MYRKPQILIVLLWMVMGVHLVRSQDVPQLKLPNTDYSSVTPEVAKFGKYGDVPVDLSTGRINYTIPLYTIKVADQEFPITLSYNFNGLKNEIPGSAGVGWDLMVGGSLSVQSQGGNDGQYSYHIQDKVLPVMNNEARCEPQNLGQKLLELLELPNVTTNGNSGDTEPDKFVVSSPYISATFYQNQLDDYIFIPHMNYRVSKQEGNVTTQGYTVVDDQGTSYMFHSANHSATTSTPDGGDASIISSLSYGLTQIDLHSQKGSLFFTYNATRPFSSQKRTYSRTYKLLNYNGQTYENHPSNEGYTTITSGTSEKLLTHIGFPNGEVELQYAQGRISELRIWSLLPNGSRKLFIKYGFEFDSYGYLLEKITKTSRDNNEEPFYHFNYHSPITIPNLGEGDLGTDPWGFLNGRPHTYPEPGHANKAPAHNASMPGALEKITYPTGGSTVIQYEANTVHGNLYPYDAPNKTSTQYNVVKSVTASSPEVTRDVATFTLDKQADIEVEYSFNLPNYESAEISIYTEPNGPRVFFRNEDDAYVQPSGQLDLTLSAGTYSLIADIAAQTPASAYLGVRGDKETTVNPQFVIGGLRVLETTDCPGTGTDGCVTRNYTYGNPVLLDIPVLNYNTLLMGQVGYSVYYDDAEVFISNNQAAFCTYNGSHLLYKTVEVFDNGNGTNGKKVLRYTGNSNLNVTDTQQPFVPYLRRDWEKGKLLSEEIYKYEGGAYVKIKETTNTYAPIYPFHNPTDHFTSLYQGAHSDKVVWGFVSAQHKQMPVNPAVPYTCVDQRYYYEFDFYAYLPQRYDLVSTEIIEDGVVKSQYYHYDNDFGQVKRMEVPRNTEGDITTYYFTYPYDLSGATFTELVNQNRIGEAVELETEYDTLDTENSVINYGITEHGLWLPTDNTYQKRGSPSITQTTYDQFSAEGRLEQYTPLGGSPTSLIWGYHGQYVVAKIENATRTEIEGLSGFGNDFDTGSGALTLQQEQTLRSLLPNAMVTTYTYEPLVGLASMTDPRGYTTHYAYDEFNRLKEVRDAEDKLVEQYQYNYKNQ